VSGNERYARRSNTPEHEWKMGEARLRDFLQGLQNDEHQHEGDIKDDRGRTYCEWQPSTQHMRQRSEEER